MKPCSVPGCHRPAASRGMCGTHYERVRRRGTLELWGNLERLAGQRFGRLLVGDQADRSATGEVRWHCRCDCGNETIVQGNNLKSGHIQSCGCLGDERRRENNRTHGLSKSRTYRSWRAMRRRCFDHKYREFHLYGGRGISVCERWNASFEAFLADMGERPQGTSIDRYPDVNGNYEPGNCRWATPLEQAHNKRRPE